MWSFDLKNVHSTIYIKFARGRQNHELCINFLERFPMWRAHQETETCKASWRQSLHHTKRLFSRHCSCHLVTSYFNEIFTSWKLFSFLRRLTQRRRRKTLWHESEMTNGSFITTLHCEHFVLTKSPARDTLAMNWISRVLRRAYLKRDEDKDEFKNSQQPIESEDWTCLALRNKMEISVKFWKLQLKCQRGLGAVAFVLHYAFELRGGSERNK